MKKSVKESRVACFIRNGLLILILVIMSSEGYSQWYYNSRPQFLFNYYPSATNPDGTRVDGAYRHHMASRHFRKDIGKSGVYNAIDFYLWEDGQRTYDLGRNRIMSLTNDGVGISVENPTVKLDVNGDVRFRSLDSQPNLTNYNKVLVANSDGNIGSASVSELPKLWETSGSESSADIFRAGKVGIGKPLYDNEFHNILFAVLGKVHIVKTPEEMAFRKIKVPFTTINAMVDLDEFNLFVHGGIVTPAIMITDDSWSDWVFHADYKLPTLEEWEEYIEKNRHLPGIPSEKDIIENGYQVHDMNKRFLEKIEQLALHIIKQQKEIEVLQFEIKKIKRMD